MRRARRGETTSGEPDDGEFDASLTCISFMILSCYDMKRLIAECFSRGPFGQVVRAFRRRRLRSGRGREGSASKARRREPRAATPCAWVFPPPVLADASSPALLALASLPPVLADLRPEPPHSLHWVRRLPCSQMPLPPHSLHHLRSLPCSQMPEPPHSLQTLPPVLADALPPHSLHWLRCLPCSQMPRPRTPCTCFAASRARRCSRPPLLAVLFDASRARRCPSPRTPSACNCTPALPPVLADARPPHSLHLTSQPPVLADARAPALLEPPSLPPPCSQMLSAPALLALGSPPPVLADAPAPALLAHASLPPVLADPLPRALLAVVPSFGLAVHAHPIAPRPPADARPLSEDRAHGAAHRAEVCGVALCDGRSRFGGGTTNNQYPQFFRPVVDFSRPVVFLRVGPFTSSRASAFTRRVSPGARLRARSFPRCRPMRPPRPPPTAP